MGTYFDRIKRKNKWFIDTITTLIEQNTKEYGIEDLSSQNQNEMLKKCLCIAFNTSNNDFHVSICSAEEKKREVHFFYYNKKNGQYCNFIFNQLENSIDFTSVFYSKKDCNHGVGYKKEKSYLYITNFESGKVTHYNFEHVSEKNNFKDINDTLSILYDFKLEEIIKESLITIGSDKDKDKTIKLKNKKMVI